MAASPPRTVRVTGCEDGYTGGRDDNEVHGIVSWLLPSSQKRRKQDCGGSTRTGACGDLRGGKKVRQRFHENRWVAGLWGHVQTALRLWIWNLAHPHGYESATGRLQVQCRVVFKLILGFQLSGQRCTEERVREKEAWVWEPGYWRIQRWAGRGERVACGEFLKTPLLWPPWAILRPVEVKAITGWKGVSYDDRVGRTRCVHVEIAGVQREAGMSTEPTFSLKVTNDTYSKNAQWSESP